jgi:hypothetical protein
MLADWGRLLDQSGRAELSAALFQGGESRPLRAVEAPATGDGEGPGPGDKRYLFLKAASLNAMPLGDADGGSGGRLTGVLGPGDFVKVSLG